MTHEHRPALDEQIDMLLDGELEGRAARRAMRQVVRDPARCRELAELQRVVAMLREPEPCPDLTERILANVHTRRGFLPAALRRWVSAGRLAVAAGILLALLSVAALHRFAPEATLNPSPAPVTALVDASAAEASRGADRLRGAVHDLRRSLTHPVDRLVETRADLLAGPAIPAPDGSEYTFAVAIDTGVTRGGGEPSFGVAMLSSGATPADTEYRIASTRVDPVAGLALPTQELRMISMVMTRREGGDLPGPLPATTPSPGSVHGRTE